jgi:hypothetical protein
MWLTVGFKKLSRNAQTPPKAREYAETTSEEIPEVIISDDTNFSPSCWTVILNTVRL